MSRSRDARDVFVVGVAEACDNPGMRQRFVLAGPLPGVVMSSAWVPDEADVHVDVTVECQGTNVMVDGVAQARWVGECRRCLRPTAGDLEVGFREVYERRPAPGAAMPGPVDDETFLLEDDELDLRPMLIEAMVLELPLAPLCSDTCPGPAPEAHPVSTSEEEDEEDTSGGRRDPRWAPLDQIRFD